MKKRSLIIAIGLLALASVAYADNYALNFDGTDYVNCGTISLSGSTLTLECWINPDNFNDTSDGCINLIGTENGSNSAFLRLGDNHGNLNKVQFVLEISGQQKLWADTVLSENTWYHIAGVYDATVGMKIYINGVLDTSNTQSGEFTSNEVFLIGNDVLGNRAYAGQMDEVRIWSTARTATEIADNMNKALDGTETGLVAYYNMDQGSGTNLTDITGNGNDGTIDGASWVSNEIYDVTIQSESSSANGSWSGDDPKIWIPNATGSTVSTTDIVNFLNAGTSVTITTGLTPGSEDGDIRFDGDISMTGSSEVTLTLEAYRNIMFTSNTSTTNTDPVDSGEVGTTTSSSGALNVILNSRSQATSDSTAGMVWLPRNSSISTNGGDVVIGGGIDPESGYAIGINDTSAEHNSVMRGVSINGGIIAGGGNITIHGQGCSSNAARGVNISGGASQSVSTTGSGTIDIVGIGYGSYDGISVGDSWLVTNGLYASGIGTVSAEDGAITLAGTKGTGDKAININSGSLVTTTGTGNLAWVSTSGDIVGATGTTTDDGGRIVVGGDTSITVESDGEITLDHELNDFAGTLSISADADTGTYPDNNIVVVDTNALELGAISTSGTIDIASGAVDAGDLTLTGALTSSDTTTSAIILNGGEADAAGSTTGGNIVVSGGAVSVGSGGTALLYTGSVSGSISVIGLTGYDSSQVYYSSDESSTLSPSPEVDKLYVIYREAEPPGNALVFDGTDDYINFASSPPYSDPITIEAWIKTTSTTGENNIVCWGYTVNSTNVQFRASGGKLEFGIDPYSVGWVSTVGTSDVNTGTWVHVAVVKDGSSVKLYVNGVLDGSGTNDRVPTEVDTFLIGKYYNSESYFDGTIDEVRIWNVARTQEEIQNDMRQCLEGNESGLVAYYKMNHSSGTTLSNSTINAYDGTLVNMDDSAWVSSEAFYLNVTYFGNSNTGGTVPVDGNSYPQGDTVTILDNTGSLLKTGYTFSGWNTDADGNGTTYQPGDTLTMGSTDIELYALWTVAAVEVSDESELNTALSSSADTIILTSDIEISSAVSITSDVVIDGDNHIISVPTPGLSDEGDINDSPSTFGVFSVSGSVDVTIKNMTIKGGRASGGGINVGSGATVRVENCSISNGRGNSSGGGIYNSGTVYIVDSGIMRNSATYGGGFLNNSGATMFIENSFVAQNRSESTSGGGGAGQNVGTLYINNSTFSNNRSTEIGGGINNYYGTLWVLNSTFAGNVAYGNYNGGAIGVNGGSATVINSLFAYNYYRSAGSVTAPTAFTLDDIYLCSGSAYLYYNVFQGNTDSTAAASNITYSGSADGSDDTLFSGGIFTLITDADNLEIGTAEVYQPFLIEIDTITTASNRAVTLKTGSDLLGSGYEGTQTGYDSSDSTSVIVGYYDKDAGTPAWVDLSGSGASGYEVTTDQFGEDRTTFNVRGAVSMEVDDFYMLKVTADANGTVSGGSPFGELYASGTSVTLTAAPDTGYAFVRWEDDAGNTLATDNPYTVTVTSTETIVPIFSLDKPTVAASSIVVDDVTLTTMTLSWTAGDGDSRIVVIEVNGTADVLPVDGETYTADTVFGSGDVTGSGNYVVYNGTGTSVTVTGLASGTVYDIAIYEYNGSSGSEAYLETTPATASQATQEDWTLSFDGTDDYVDCGNATSLQITGNLTVEAWVNLSVLGSERAIVSKFTHSGSAEGYELVITSANQPRFSVGRNYNDWSWADSPDALTTNRWYHIAGVYDGATIFIYVDGVLKNSVAFSSGIVDSGSSLCIGKRGSVDSLYFSGIIDEVRIWNVARTSAEISDNMALALSGNESGLAAYYSMDEGSGTAISDGSTNTNTGTIYYGAAWVVKSGFTVTGTATYLSGGGTISPTTQVVNSGDSVAFTVTPEAGSSISTVSGCGGTLSGNTYTTAALIGACEVTAYFIADTDSDSDGTPDYNDGCPNDPAKTEPGTCGCGVADTDTDNDGTPDCNDNCPNDADKTGPGTCGCGTPDTDTDNDGTPDCNDGCPNDPAKTEPGTCGCGVADTDSDNDGTPDCNDNCPNDADKTGPGTCGCGVADTDTDNDGTPDCNDNCPNDADKTGPGTCGCGVADTDSDNDGTPDCIDHDSDSDKDGLSDHDEVALGTDPLDEDSDGDGALDGDEVDAGSDPLTETAGPGVPVPVFPENGATGTELPVDLVLTQEEDAATGLHESTRWQIATDEDFSALVMDITSDTHLLSLTVPDQILEGETGYFWRARFLDTNAMVWMWSDTQTFASAADEDGNDLPEDTDGDGTYDDDDNCPGDPDKIAPGTCGCGVADTDSDNDGTPDCIDHDSDSDNDGLSDHDEVALGTDPLDEDSDGDGALDGDEVAAGSDPLTETAGPGVPVPVFPENGAVDTNLPMELVVTHNEEAYTDLHESTRWQIAIDEDFSALVMDVTSDTHLLSLTVPDQILEGETGYFWRARFLDTNAMVWMWSDAQTFTSAADALIDEDGNGLPDDQELAGAAAIGPDAAEGWQDGIFWLDTSVTGQDGSIDERQAGLRLSDDNSRLIYFGWESEDEIDERCPEELITVVLSIKIEVPESGGSTLVQLYFSPALSEGADDETIKGYKYDAVNGWVEYTNGWVDYIEYEGVSCVTLKIVDGGDGDADGIENGIIVDPVGMVSDAGSEADSTITSSGDGFCFIQSVLETGKGKSGTFALFMLIICAAAGMVYISKHPVE